MSYWSYSKVIFALAYVCLRRSNCCVGVAAELISWFTSLISGNTFWFWRYSSGRASLTWSNNALKSPGLTDSFSPPLFRFVITVIETRREIQIQQKGSHRFRIHRPRSFGTGSVSPWKPSFTSLQTAHTTVLTKAPPQPASTCAGIASWDAAGGGATGSSSLGRLQGVGNCRGLWTQMPSLGDGTRRVIELLFSFGHLKHKYSPVSCHGCLLFLIYLPGFTKTVLPYEEYYGISSFSFVLSLYCIPWNWRNITSIPVHHKVQMFLRTFSHFYINEMHTLFF